MSLGRSVCAAVLGVALVAPAPAGGRAPIRLTLRPAAAPAPALRYRLMPELMDQTPGNAVELYRQAVEALKKARKEDDGGPTGDVLTWLKLPAAELPRAQARNLLVRYREVFRLADRAARCESCDWRLVERVRQHGLDVKLVEIPPTVELARLLALRARLEIVEGRADAALHALRIGLTVARQVGDGPLFVCPLLGSAIATPTLRELELFLTMEKAPNLYWALADLPRPFLDLRKPLEGERFANYAVFPGLLDVAHDRNAGPMTPEQIKASAAAVSRRYLADKGTLERARLALLIRAKHAGAKEALVAAGRPRAKVEQMPHLQVALLHAMQQFDREYDTLVRWRTLPYAEAQKGLEEATGRISATRALALLPSKDVPALPLFDARFAEHLFADRAHLDRRVAALRCVEAIRLYAAAHGGRLPPTLAAIKEVPVPDDPFTGKPFAYRLENDTATLEALAPASLTYELTLKK